MRAGRKSPRPGNPARGLCAIKSFGILKHLKPYEENTTRRTPAFAGSPAIGRAADGAGRSQYDSSNQGRSPGTEFQGDGSRLLSHRCERSAPAEFERIPGGWRLGREAAEGIRPVQRPPGEVGAIRQGLEPGILF